jgi:peptidoglycan/LPS O-acetylase OafA/YrhL
MKLTYYKNLDGLRGIAALMVVVFHFYSYPEGFYNVEGSLFKKLSEIGQHGVSLFFVLSGFVITRILINAKNEGQYFQKFFIRRILRIAPLYYLFLLFWFYILPFIINYPIAPVAKQIPYFFYLQNIYSTLKVPMAGPPHFWSLAVEEHFYLVWPLIIYYSPLKHLTKVIGFSIALIFVLKYFMITHHYSVHDFTLTRMDQILMGAFLAILEPGNFYKPEAIRFFLKIGLFIIPVSVAIYAFGSQYHFLKEIIKYFLLGITFACLIALVLSLKPESKINTFLTSPPLQYLGRISYGIYVWHVIALIFLQHFLLTTMMALDMAITFILTILMAHFSYYYFELVFIRLKDSVQIAPVAVYNKLLYSWAGIFRFMRRL